MRRGFKLKFKFVSCLAAVAITPVVAQTASSSGRVAIRAGSFAGVIAASGAGRVAAGLSLFEPMGGQPVLGRPYSAERVTEHVQTLADGTHITQTFGKTLFYRDSEGRTRTENVFTPPPGAPANMVVPQWVTILDPVAGYRYILNPTAHTVQCIPWKPIRMRQPNTTQLGPAHSAWFIQAPHGNIAPAGQKLPAIIPPLPMTVPTAPAVAPTTASKSPHPTISRESLGTEEIDGVDAEGSRVTTVYPEGFFGNDRPITVVSETWISPDLQMVVLSKTSDPRSGESTTKLINISQDEPDPSLFSSSCRLFDCRPAAARDSAIAAGFK